MKHKNADEIMRISDDGEFVEKSWKWNKYRSIIPVTRVHVCSLVDDTAGAVGLTQVASE